MSRTANENVLMIGSSHVKKLQQLILSNDIELPPKTTLHGSDTLSTGNDYLIEYLDAFACDFEKIVVLSDFHTDQSGDTRLYKNSTRTLDYLHNQYGEKLYFACLNLAEGDSIDAKDRWNLSFINQKTRLAWAYRKIRKTHNSHIIEVCPEFDQNLSPSDADDSVASLFRLLYQKLQEANVLAHPTHRFNTIQTVADKAFREKRYGIAAERYLSLAKLSADKHKVLNNYAVCAMKTQNYASLIDLVSKIPQSISIPFQTLTLVGQACFKLKRYSESEHFIKQSLGINRKQAVAFLTLSRLQYEKGDLERAYETANYALILNNTEECREHIQYLLDVTENQDLSNVTQDKDYTQPIVAMGRQQTLFLLGGAHKVKDYARGSIKPSSESIENFVSNLSSRKAYCEERGIDFLHVVFPDKQSILPERFPYHQAHNLTEYYLANEEYKSSNVNAMYPLGVLQDLHCEDNREVCIKGDSHISDRGCIAIVKDILRAVEKESYETLSAYIEDENYASYKIIDKAGDLGVKYSPPFNASTESYSHKNETSSIVNGVKSNDGLCAVWLNEKSISDKTVLIFGDSYFSMLSRYLSLVYKKVMFCRTRYFHPEVVDDVSPDHLFTGNAERYLSFVYSDGEAEPFAEYYGKAQVDVDKYRVFSSAAAIDNGSLRSVELDAVCAGKRAVG